MPYVAYAILGKGGVAAVLLMIFQAITSALSSGREGLGLIPFIHSSCTDEYPCAETVAVTSLITYDIYRTYINPSAAGKQILLVSHVTVVVFSVVVALVAVGLCYAKFSVSFIVTAIGIVIDGMSKRSWPRIFGRLITS